MANISRELYNLVDFGRWTQSIHRCNSHGNEACFVHSKTGQSVLHLACIRDAPVDVVSALLHANPSAAMCRDKSGCTPLHDACHRASDKVVRKLLEHNVMPVFLPDEDGLTPLSYLCVAWRDTIRSAHHRLLLPDQNPADLLNRDWILGRLWEKVRLFVRAAYCGTIRENQEKKFRIVHACAAIRDCPPDVLKLAVQFHPEQLKEEDALGNLPLHMAAASNFTLCASPAEEQECDIEDEGHFSPIDYLLMFYPDASRVQNFKEKLPLHLAIDSGKPWVGGIGSILRSYPGAICRKDGGNGLFPFMAAAAASEGEGSRLPVGSIFELLRRCPELERFQGGRRVKITDGSVAMTVI